MFLPLQTPTKELDVPFLVFVERYATDLLRWDILAFFARNPNFCAPEAGIAQQIGRSVHSVRPELGDLALLGILDQLQPEEVQPLYRLTSQPQLRRMILKFADHLVVGSPQ